MPLCQIRRFAGDGLVENTCPIKHLAFLHIEKSAGVSMRSFLANVFGDTAVSPHLNTAPVPPDASGFSIVCGHVDRVEVMAALPDAAWFTMLRHPVERVISLMNYWAEVATPKSQIWRDATPEERVAYDLAGTADFDEFVNSRNAKVADQVRNLACRRILGESQGNRSTAEYASRAFEHLQNEALLFGLQERFAWSIAQFPLLLQISATEIDLAAACKNVTHRKRISRTSDHLPVAGILDADMMLYENASVLFEQRIASLIALIYRGDGPWNAR